MRIEGVSDLTLSHRLSLAQAELSKGPHPERARPDAEALLLHVTRRTRASLLAHQDEPLDPVDAGLYCALVARRLTGEPMQYISGETEFYGMPFRVTPDVLIPRPETEHLVEKVIGLLPCFTKPRIVDVGTGSGVIAVALAHEWPGAAITAIDISAPALELARWNAERLGFAACIRFLQGDLLAPVAVEQFEIVVSNPPYVAEADRDSLSVEVREYEPAQALFAGGDGLDVYRRLIPAAFRVLVPGGRVALEMGDGQRVAMSALLGDSGFEQLEFASDLQGIPRVASGRRPLR
jgi:release factor glutamine methyltransferase